jgi:broad specificity phosphatase PhoE
MSRIIQKTGRRLASFVALAMTVLATPTQAAQATPTPLSAQELVDALQAGGLVLLIRHERTEVPSRRDDYSQPPGECRAQRNLSVAGVAGSHETGVSLRALDIEVERVITSPMCRAAETARYMFGVSYELDARLMHHEPGGARNLDVAEAEVRALLRELTPGLPGTNIALVTHGGSIVRVSGLRLTEGEIGVLRLEDHGDITVLGQITGSGLGFFARATLQGED